MRLAVESACVTGWLGVVVLLLLQYAGEWNFHVGIPATRGSSGAHMVRTTRGHCRFAGLLCRTLPQRTLCHLFM